MVTVGELKTESISTSTEYENLKAANRDNPLRRFVHLVPAGGEIHDITVAQYRQLLGKAPRAVNVKNGRVRWEHAGFDELATEYGHKSGEDFKESIEKLSADYRRERELKRGAKETKQRLTRMAKETKPEKTKEKHEGKAPVFPKSETTKAKTVKVNGLTMTANRNPAFWEIHDNKPSTPHVRVRYSKDADKLMNIAAKGHADEIQEKRSVDNTPSRSTISKKTPRISPTTPRLK